MVTQGTGGRARTYPTGSGGGGVFDPFCQMRGGRGAKRGEEGSPPSQAYAAVVRERRVRLFAGCQPEIACAPDGRILAVGPGARAAAGLDAEEVVVQGQALPGLADSHIHLESLARLRLEVDLAGSRSVDEALARVRRHAAGLAPRAWVVGGGWDNAFRPDGRRPGRPPPGRARGRP